jgi:hypothetical protein
VGRASTRTGLRRRRSFWKPPNGARLDGFFTLYECNNRGPFDPEYVGFTIKGVSHLFAQVGIPLDGIYKLAELVDRLVRHQPASTMSHMLRLIYKDYARTGDLEVDFKNAA